VNATPDPHETRRRQLQTAIDACPPGYGRLNGVRVGGVKPAARRHGMARRAVREVGGPGAWPSLRACGDALGVRPEAVFRAIRDGKPVAGVALRYAS
jgi:hypothetical protein